MAARALHAFRHGCLVPLTHVRLIHALPLDTPSTSEHSDLRPPVFFTHVRLIHRLPLDTLTNSEHSELRPSWVLSTHLVFTPAHVTSSPAGRC